jgi:type IV secretion system protein TrbL
MCGKVDVGCRVSEGLGTVISNVAEGVVRQLSDAVLSVLHSQATFWLQIDSPTLATQDAKGHWKSQATIAFLQAHTFWLTTTLFTLAIMLAGIRIAWEQRADPLRQLLKAMMTFVLVSSAGTAALQLLSAWSDSFAQSIVSAALPPDTSYESAMKGVMMQDGSQIAQRMPLFLIVFSALGVLFGSLIQIVLLLIRSAMLVLLAGLFPLATVATNTEIGKAWFKKFCGWSLAFIAYKPAAALIYAAAIRMTHDGMFNPTGDGLVQTLTGMMMLGLAVVALPALLRFTVPLTAAAAGGSSGSGAAAMDPGGLATGAINVGRSSGSKSGSGAGMAGGGGGGGGPSGAGGGASGGGSGAASKASGALGAAAGGAGVAMAATKKAAGAMAGAVSHSAGEAGGGSGSSSSSASPAGSRSGRSGSGSGGSRSGGLSSGAGGSGSGGGTSPRPSGARGASSSARPQPPPPSAGSSTSDPAGPSGGW